MGLILFFVPFLNLIYNLFFIGYFKFEIKFEYFQDYLKPLIFYCELIQDISNTYEGKLLFSTIESIFPILYYVINYGWKDLFSMK